MRKTVDFSETELAIIEEYRQRNGLKNFSVAIKNIIGRIENCQCSSNDVDIPEDKFEMITDAIKKLDEKLENMSIHVAPKSAGEVK
jgi:hypothetical protein